MVSSILVLLTVLIVSEVSSFLPYQIYSRNGVNINIGLEAASESSDHDSTTAGKCPFSKNFPRYRIELSRPRKEEEKKSKFPSIPIITGLKKSWGKSSLDQLYRETPIRWLDEQSGLDLFASLWRATADLSSEETLLATVIVFDDNQLGLVRQWVDILEWMQSQELLYDESVRINAEVVSDEAAPTHIKLNRQGNANNMQSTESGPGAVKVDRSLLEKRTKAWVKRILVDQGICPFTKSVKVSGQGLADLDVPVGQIFYCSSDATTSQISLLMADAWESIQEMIAMGPGGKKGISSILLAAPFFDDDFDLWSGQVFTMLEAGVVAAGVESQVGVVCFHPQYATPDGSSWPGFGHMHSVPRLQKWLNEEDPDNNLTADEVAAGGAWQRRTPHATINVLRADQLEAAEGRRNTPQLYSKNIQKLVGKADGVGLEKLAKDLEQERKLEI